MVCKFGAFSGIFYLVMNTNGTLRGFFYHLFSVIYASLGFSISFCTSGYLRVTGRHICRRPELPLTLGGSRVMLPENFEVLDSRRCILMHFHVFFGCFVSFFFAPKSTNFNKFEVNYVTMK